MGSVTSFLILAHVLSPFMRVLCLKGCFLATISFSFSNWHHGIDVHWNGCFSRFNWSNSNPCYFSANFSCAKWPLFLDVLANRARKRVEQRGHLTVLCSHAVLPINANGVYLYATS